MPHAVMAGLTGHLLLLERSSNVNGTSNSTTYHRVVTYTAHSVGHISNGYRPYAVRPSVSHWTSMPYEAILCRNPGRNLPEIRHTIALKVLWKCLWLNDLPLFFEPFRCSGGLIRKTTSIVLSAFQNDATVRCQ